MVNRVVETRNNILLKASVIVAPYAANDSALTEAMASLRVQGEIVVELLPGETEVEGLLCDRQLVERGGQWIVEATV